jgi:hypothetical protein
MNQFIVEITETYRYQITVNANTSKEALEKVKAIYKNDDPEYSGVFCADATSHDKTTFKITK